MNYISGKSERHMEGSPHTHQQVKKELQHLNDRLSAYVCNVRQLEQQLNNADSSTVLRSTKILDDEIANLKNLYETELENLRKEVEAGARERYTLQTKCSSQAKYIEDNENKLSAETERNGKLLYEIGVLQRRIGDLDSEIHKANILIQQPQENMKQLQRQVDNLSRELDQWKHRYEQEKLVGQEAENKLELMLKKMAFSDQVHEQQINDYKNRLDVATTTILNLETRLQDLGATKASNSEMLKQMQARAEEELRNYKTESDEKYIRNLSALRAQIDNDADTIRKVSQENSELTGKLRDLQAKTDNLEAQVANLQHQKLNLENSAKAERAKAADSILQLEKNLRRLQDMLMFKMTEMANTQPDASLKSEIDALKAVLEEEEKRLQMPLGRISTASIQTAMPNVANNFLNSNSPFTNNKKDYIGFGQSPSSQLLTSMPVITAASSFPAMSYNSTDYDHNRSWPGQLGIERLSPLNTFYIPQELRTPDKNVLDEHGDFDTELADTEFGPPRILLPMTGPQYDYKIFSEKNRFNSYPQLPSRAVGPIQAKTKSAPVKSQRDMIEKHQANEQTDETNKNYNPACFEISNNTTAKSKFQDPCNNDQISNPRPKSSPFQRPSSSSLQRDTDVTTSAIGDLKIVEVNEEGRFVKLLNDGPTEREIGEYTIKQIIGGRPEAVFRFPTNTKVPPESTVTVWSAMNDPSVHNPPTDYFWKEEEKLRTGPNCTTLLCTASGQAVAWTKSSHRFSKDAFYEDSDAEHKIETDVNNNNDYADVKDNETLTPIKMDINFSRPEAVLLRRVKKQPPSLFPSKHPHGMNPSSVIHPHTGQERTLHFGIDSTHSDQSRSQTIRPDPIPDHPQGSATFQRTGSRASRKTGSSKGIHSAASWENGILDKISAANIGEISEGPSSFMRPHNKFATGLKQICSQHNLAFLPPMPHPPILSQ